MLCLCPLQIVRIITSRLPLPSPSLADAVKAQYDHTGDPRFLIPVWATLDRLAARAYLAEVRIDELPGLLGRACTVCPRRLFVTRRLVLPAARSTRRDTRRTLLMRCREWPGHLALPRDRRSHPPRLCF